MTEHHFDEVVPEALDGQRVDRVVAIIADASRRQAGKLVADGAVEVDGRVMDKPSFKLEAGQSIRFGLVREDDLIEPDPTIEVPACRPRARARRRGPA
ncbi:MAG: S4 domain-containing protein, partial [Actinomycetota bacterium]